MRRASILAIVTVACAVVHVTSAVAASAQDRVEPRGAAVAPAGAADVLVRAAAARRRTELLARDVAARLDEARRRRDLVRAHCLDETLSEVGALLRTHDARIGELRAALESRATVRRERYQSMLGIWNRRAHELRRQADACVGEASPDAATTTVETTNDGPVPDVALPPVEPWNDATVLRLRP